MMKDIIELVNSNQVLIAGLGLSSMGLITFWIRDIPVKIFKFFKRQFTTDLIIHNYDTIFYEVLKWIKSENKNKNFRTLKLNNGRWGNSDDLAITMGYGFHIVRYKRRYLFIYYDMSKESISDKVKESIIIVKFGRNKKLFEELLKDIELSNKDNDKLTLYKMGDCWQFSNYVRKRPLDTIFIEKDKKKLLIDNLNQFKGRESWYLENGIPYQYGILLYGDPGTGKTSLIKAIASVFDYDIYYLAPSKLSSIAQALTDCPENAIVVIEDIDTNTVVHERGNQEVENKQNTSDEFLNSFAQLNLSDILNSIDGLNNVHGRVLICTTNHIEQLDKALIRPGRFDLLVEIGFVNKEILKEFLTFYFPKVPIDLNNVNIKKDLSVASLQNMVLLNYDSDRILKEIKE